MCGISGFINFTNSGSYVNKGKELIEHEGIVCLQIIDKQELRYRFMKFCQ